MTPVSGVSQYLQKLSALSPTSALGGATPKSEEEALARTAQEFEAMFIAELLKAGSNSDMSAKLFGDSRAMKIFSEMRDEAYAEEMARAGGMGIAKMLCKELGRSL